MVTLFMVREKGEMKLRPFNEHDEEELAKIPVGKLLKVEATHSRSTQHHRKYMALVRLIWENQSRYPTVDLLNAAIKVASGHYVPMHMADGTLVRVPKSISFAAMDQSAFSAFYDSVIHLVCEEIIPGLDEGKLRKELEGIVE